ncbi:MAG: ATP-binding cassette domain-containing protein [Myxococcota bacterium]|nr:ATP-binding cassette domain-containing protein [Myxococcota bacterium]
MTRRDTRALLQVQGLKKYFPVRTGWRRGARPHIRALDGVSFEVARGETLGLVGESGCGKTTCGRALIRLVMPSAGHILFDGVDVRAARGAVLIGLRRRMQMIFQNPFASLNPRRTMGDIVGDPLVVHGIVNPGDKVARVAAICDQVGLSPNDLCRFPHEFSGGQRQRIAIARAIALGPDFVVCDEPVSSLDASIQAQIIHLLIDLRERLQLAYLFISHDLAVVRNIAHRVAVMYLGRIVELGPRDAVFTDPKHPYTQALLSAARSGQALSDRPLPLLGEPPSPIHPPVGCPFHPRCPTALRDCSKTDPPLNPQPQGGFYRCVL